MGARGRRAKFDFNKMILSSLSVANTKILVYCSHMALEKGIFCAFVGCSKVLFSNDEH